MNRNSKNKGRCMYNEDLKKKYIVYAISISQSENLNLFERGLINCFYRSQSLELQIGKDICAFNELEARKFLKQFLSGGVLYQTFILSSLRSYVEWAIQNGVTSISKNSFSEIKVTDIDVSESYVDTMVKDENDLIDTLSNVLCDIELETIDNFRWCVFLLIFAGISFKDIFYIRQDDVNLHERVIQLGSQTYNITDGLFNVLQHYIKMTEFQKNGKNDSEYVKPIINEGYLLSNSKPYGINRDKMRHSCTSDISLIMKKCSKRLKPASIHDSGIFYRMYLKEQATGKIDCLEYLRARKIQSVVINFPNRVKKMCKLEYETWKRAFGL